MNELLVGHISTHDNYSDLLTKVAYGGKIVKLASAVIWDLYDQSAYLPKLNNLDWINLEGTGFGSRETR